MARILNSHKRKRAPRKSLRTVKHENKRGTNPNSLANLEPHKFQPGESGNPGGRPKLLGESYRAWLANLNTAGTTNAEAVALAMGIEALKGDVAAAREIRSATEGDTVQVFGMMTDAELDEFIAARQGAIGDSSRGEGTSPAADHAETK